MYQIFKDVISTGNFELGTMLDKVDTMWVKGKITNEQKDELIALARTNADPGASLNVMQALADLNQRVTKLERGETVTPPAPGKYPEYVDGTAAYNGQRYMWKGEVWEVSLPEYVNICTFSPDRYPNYWRKVTEETV